MSRRDWLPFEEARAYVQGLKLKNSAEWRMWSKSGQRPFNIPGEPCKVYPNEWRGFGDWLGTGTIATQTRVYPPFEEARAYIHTLGLKNHLEWCKWSKSGQKPADIPTDPCKVYAAEWVTWGDWLGTGNMAPSERVYRPFEVARRYVRELELKSQKEWATWSASGQRPLDIPSRPDEVYPNEWRGFGDWLGTGRVATSDPRFIRVTREHISAQRMAHHMAWKARKLSVIGRYTASQIREMLKRHRYRCYYCRTKLQKNPTSTYGYRFHVDHTFPLARVAGTDIPANDISYLVPACPVCNMKKQDKFPWEWAEGGKLL